MRLSGVVCVCHTQQDQQMKTKRKLVKNVHLNIFDQSKKKMMNIESNQINIESE